MKIIGALEVPCRLCGAEIGERCSYMFGPGGRRGRQFRFGQHAGRIHDAGDVQRAVNALLDN